MLLKVCKGPTSPRTALNNQWRMFVRHWAMAIDDPSVRARLRAASARQRLQQLQKRCAALAGEELLRGPTQEDLQAAAEALATAKRRAEDARESAKNGFRRAIAAHERAARRHDQAADSGVGDVSGHRRRAAEHRAAATADRAVLAAAFGDVIDD
jgi:hypothetical protein